MEMSMSYQKKNQSNIFCIETLRKEMKMSALRDNFCEDQITLSMRSERIQTD